MTQFAITVTDNNAVCTHQRGILTAGMTGAGITVTFHEAWDNLQRMAVFRCGDTVVDAPMAGDSVSIPPKALLPDEILYVGLYGTDGESVVIPTVWAELGLVEDAADPSGDESTDPALPIWAALQAQIEAMEVPEDVLRSTPQTLTPAQQTQARANIGASSQQDMDAVHVEVSAMPERVKQEVMASLLKFEASGDFVEFTPKEGAQLKVVSHYEQIVSSNCTYLYHVNSKNLFDFAGILGGAGTVFEKNGLRAVINDDATVTVTGTNTSADWTNIIFKQSPNIDGKYVAFPPGTYTVPRGLTLGLRSKGSGSGGTLVEGVGLGNKTGTITVDDWFVIDSFYIAYAGGAASNVTLPLVLVRGATLPTSDYGYSGNIYEIKTDTDPGIFDWSTGQVSDTDGNYVETWTTPAITALPGTNYIWSIGGTTEVSGASNFMGTANVTDAFTADGWGLPVLKLTGNTTAMTKDNPVTLNYTYGTLKGTCTCKWQGASSLAYPKKNYTIQFDQAFEASTGWGAQSKYCFKANYIDHSHARNLVNAKLWGQIVRSRSAVPARLSGLINCGAVDGFPVLITLNDDFHGLYTLNIPKDGWLFGMGSGEGECILCADAWNDATGFKTSALVDEDFSLEYVTDEDNADWVAASLNRLINACINSNGADLDTTIAQYLDWDSAIDYYIFTVLAEGQDMTRKNYILVTFDGTKWFFSAYDMDSTHGLYWNGQSFYAADVNPTFASYAKEHRVMELIKTYKKDALKARYAQLRETVLSESNLATLVSNFTGKIPSPVYLQDVKKWPMIPNSSVNNAAQIRDYYRMRVACADAWMEAL